VTTAPETDSQAHPAAIAVGAELRPLVTRLLPEDKLHTDTIAACVRNLRGAFGNELERATRFELATLGLGNGPGTTALCGTTSQPAASKGISGNPGSQPIAPKSTVSQLSCYPLATRPSALHALRGGARDLLCAREVAKRLGVCTATVYKLCSRGELAHVRVSNSVRVVPADLDAFIAAKARGR